MLFSVCVSLWPVDCVTRSPGLIAPFPSPLLLLTSAVSKQHLCLLLISSLGNIEQISSLWKIKLPKGFKGHSDLSYLPPEMASQIWEFICESCTQVTCLQPSALLTGRCGLYVLKREKETWCSFLLFSTTGCASCSNLLQTLVIEVTLWLLLNIKKCVHRFINSRPYLIQPPLLANSWEEKNVFLHLDEQSKWLMNKTF